MGSAATDRSWHVFEGQYDGNALYARFDTSVGSASDRASYGIQIGVAVPLNVPDDRGLPQSPELDELAAIEEQVLSALGERAVLVGVITTRSMREFVLYSQSASWVEAFDHELRELVGTHTVQVMARRDPDWDVYRQFVK